MKLIFSLILFIFFISNAYTQQTFNKLNVNTLKLPLESISRAMYIDASGVLRASSGVTATELEYIGGLTSDAQTQINGKQATGNYITALTGNVVATGPGSVSATIQSNVVTNAMLSTVATATFKGRTTSGTGNVEDLSATQATALLNTMVGDSGSGGTKGLVPAPTTGDATKFLKGDGTWASPASGSFGYEYGSLTYARTASCIWSGASTSWANFSADTDCPTPSVSGCASAPGTKIPGVVCDVAAAGTYTIVAHARFNPSASTVAAQLGWRWNDGTDSDGLALAKSTGVINAGIGANSEEAMLLGRFKYTSGQTGSKTFQIQQSTSSGSNSCQISASSGDYEYMGLRIFIYYMPETP